jgi:hypothetical protein
VDRQANVRLFQGEVISNLLRVRLDLASLGAQAPVIQTEIHAYAIVLTQECELDQDFKARTGSNKPDKLIPNVLFCQVSTAEQLCGTVGGSDIWKRVRQNKDERYQFLQKVDPVCDALQQGLPELAIDFKRYFTIPTDEVYKRVEINEAKRRCVLVGPYLEHLSSRFAYFIGRVALPEDHFSEPVKTSH